MAKAQSPAETQPETMKKTKIAPQTYLRVLDTTATPDTVDAAGKTISGARIHEQLVDGRVKSFKFVAGEGLELPLEVAAKFLRHEGFELVDADNNIIPYARPPKQPDELGAGEALVLKDDECVARYDELNNAALLKRVMAMPGGEKFAQNPDRAAIVKFIKAAKAAIAKANMSKTKEVGRDEFTPEAEVEDEELAA